MKLPTYIQTALALLPSLSSSLFIKSTTYTNITADPQGSVRLNGLSFQQTPLTTFASHQYIAYYATAVSPSNYGKHFVNLGRRRIHPNIEAWQIFAFTDYIQQTLDEHNTISMGISSDGYIHLSFDHHDVPLNYRVSKTGIAKSLPATWSADLFNPVRHDLPGSSGPWTPLTYPRFEPLSNGDMLMEFRIGQSGSGDSWLHLYSSSTQSWSPLGKYLQGEDNNAYINGLTSSSSSSSSSSPSSLNNNNTVHVSWTTRETPDASTNHDFYYTISRDGGKSWLTSTNIPVSKPIKPSTPGIKIFSIPQNSQIINQEAQCVDKKGRFHALMRDNSTGTARFYHYLRREDGEFSKTAMELPGLSTPPYLAYRGKIAAVGNGDDIITIIPDAPLSLLNLYTSSSSTNYTNWTRLASVPNTACEPLYDVTRLEKYGVLSLFIRQGGAYLDRKVQVWEFEIGE